MSHVSYGQTVYADLEELRLAVVQCGGEWLEGQTKAKQYNGRQVDCEHAFRPAGRASAYDLGVQRDGDGYRIAYDMFLQTEARSAFGADLGLLAQTYAERVAKKAARKRRELQVSKAKREVLQDGTVRLRIPVRRS